MRATVEKGGAARYHEANAAKGKLFARERIALLVDEGSFVEDGAVRQRARRRPAGRRRGHRARRPIDGRPVCLMANDSTVKAGSWGARTVEKIIRIIERAYAHRRADGLPGRLGRRPDHRPGRPVPRPARRRARSSATRSGPPARSRRSARCSGRRRPAARTSRRSATWSRWSTATPRCTSARDRMVEMVTGEKTTLEAMGGARVHCRRVRRRALPLQDRGRGARRRSAATCRTCRRTGRARRRRPSPAPAGRRSTCARWCRPASGRPSTCAATSRALLDEGSFFEIQALWAREVTVGFGRLDGEVVGVVGNNSMFKGGVLFVDSADKATRFVQLCDAFNVPLLFLSDVPGFMVGTAVEKQGIIRHGAKMITAISEATVPKICVVVRKAYGAGLYAMAGPGFEPDATIALPTAKIAVMGAEAAVNAVYANKIAAIADEEERAAFVGRSGARVRAGHRHRAAGQRAGRRRRSSSRHDLRAELVRRLARGPRQGPRTSPAAGTASPRSDLGDVPASSASDDRVTGDAEPPTDATTHARSPSPVITTNDDQKRPNRGVIRNGPQAEPRAQRPAGGACVGPSREFAREVVAPVIAEHYERARVPVRDRPADGQDGPVRPAVPGGVRRHGRRLLRALPGPRGAGPGRLVASRSRWRPASRSARCRSTGSAPRSRSGEWLPRLCSRARRWPRSG